MSEEHTPQGRYRFEVDDLRAAQAPVLVHTLRGSLDAGGVGELVAQHLLDSLPAQRVVTFTADEFIDYRSRRPPMTFEEFRYTGYHDPVIALDLLHDDEGRPMLLLHGPEPDLKWDAFTGDLLSLVEQLGVRLTIGVHGIPAAVPHTRPTTITTHGSSIDQVAERRAIMLGKVQVPGTLSGLIEFRVAEAGYDAAGLSANVPHYLAQTEFPQAAAEAVRWLARAGDLSLPVGELEAAAAEVNAQIAAQVSGSPEVGAVVGALEQQYDSWSLQATEDGTPPGGTRPSLTERPVDVPSADEIGAEAEAFLAEFLGKASQHPAAGPGAVPGVPDGEPAGGPSGAPTGGGPADDGPSDGGPADEAPPGGGTPAS